MAQAKFRVYKTLTGWRFQLVAGNGEPVATSETYSSKEAAKNGCDAVRRAAESAEVVVDEE